jgi:Excalibur calcium-binding domain
LRLPQFADTLKDSMYPCFFVVSSSRWPSLASAWASRPLPRASGQYRNCTQAHQDGRYDIPQDDPDYWPGGDRDGDGIACES